MLSGGRVVDSGTFDALLDAGGPFAELVLPTLKRNGDIVK